jgi:hypothetical protein
VGSLFNVLNLVHQKGINIMAKFKCNQSGNTVEFFHEHEIAEMRNHGGYTEVPPEAPKTTPSTSSNKKVAKNESSISGDSADGSN